MSISVEKRSADRRAGTSAPRIARGRGVQRQLAERDAYAFDAPSQRSLSMCAPRSSRVVVI
jgi:hypothetical protein